VVYFTSVHSLLELAEEKKKERGEKSGEFAALTVPEIIDSSSFQNGRVMKKKGEKGKKETGRNA